MDILRCNKITKQPDYFSKFKCIGSECEDTCCSGWTIEVDKSTYIKYQKCDHPELNPQLKQHLEINPNSNSDSNYSRFILKDVTCPFLDTDNLCKIQREIGEDNLPSVCYTYPRVKNRVDGVTERSLYVSCPEAARLILLSPDKLQWNAGLTSNPVSADSNIEDTAENNGSSIPSYLNRNYNEIRQFVIRLLQNRTYPIWERLTILGLFCEQLERLNTEGSQLLLSYINQLENNIEMHQYDSVVKSVIHRPMYQLDFTLKMMHRRMDIGIYNQRLLDCFDEFKKGLGIKESTTGDEIRDAYQAAYDDYFLPFINGYEYILENYISNYCVYTLFPFGRQKNVRYVPKTVFEEYIVLATCFSLIRTLLVGIAGYHKDSFATDHVIKLIQSFARVIEHDAAFCKTILKFLQDNNLNTMQFMALLVRT